MSPAIVVNDNPKTLPDAIAEITRRMENHAEWVGLNTETVSGNLIPHPNVSANQVRTSIDMARAYANVLRLLRSCGAAP